jgi:LppX_LprAFG lipoprotein
MHRVVGAAVLTAAALAMVACGGGSVSAEPVAHAATKTAALKSYRVQATTKLKLQKREITFTAKGVFDPRNKRGRMTLDMSQLNQVQGPEESPYNLGYATFVLDGSDMYMRIPLLRQTYRNLRPWVKIDLERLGRAAGADSFLQFGGGGDPTRTLQYLRGVGKLHKEGGETVRGVSTTHYTGTIDLKKVKGGDRLAQTLGQRKLPVEVWVDDDGYIRRETWKEQLDVGNGKTDVKIAMELYDFGAPVFAEVPPARDVTDLTGGTQS